MEKKLAKLFDYQKFEQNEGLSKLIKETDERQAKALTDEELEMVSAAGENQREVRKIIEDIENLSITGEFETVIASSKRCLEQ